MNKLLQLLPILILICVRLVQHQLSSNNLSPISFNLPHLPEFKPDNRLVNVPIERIGEDDLVYPESFVLSPDEKYAFISLGDGRIIRIDGPKEENINWLSLGRTGNVGEDMSKQCGKGGPADLNNMEEFCGRPLGMYYNEDDDTLLVADAYKGFIKVSNLYQQAKMHTLATRAISDSEDYTFNLLNAVVKVPSGDIYLTETSQQFKRRRIFYAAMEGRATGRLLRYKHDTGVVEVVANNIFMPNGMTLSHDEKHLFIVSGVQILTFDIESQQFETPFVTVMPGTGDNIKAMNELPNGKKMKCYYAALGGTYKQPFSLLHFLSDKPWLRSLILAIVPYTKIIDLIPKWTALAVFNEEGELIETLSDDGTQVEYPWLSEMEPVGDYMYLSSWYNPFLARIKRQDFQ